MNTYMQTMYAEVKRRAAAVRAVAKKFLQQPQIYKARITEFNGEREYLHDVYVVAESPAAAEQWAMDYAADFYAEAARTAMDDAGICWQVDGGALLYCLDSVLPDDTLLMYDAQNGLVTARLALTAE